MGKISINIKSGSIERKKVAVGIDLGTTNSLIAYVADGDKLASIIPILGGNTVPSVIHFDDFNIPSIGEWAKEQISDTPERTVYSIKRLLGKSYNDLKAVSNKLGYRIIDEGDDQLVKVEIGGQFYNPIELSSLILKELKQKAEAHLNADIEQAVITVPAYFNDSQRQATRDAGKLAGLDVLRIINEPTAASVAYGLGQNDGKTIMVYDLGGGTFDVSLLMIEDGVFEVLSTAGDTHLGGDDLDLNIVEYWNKTFLNNKELSFREIQQLRVKAEIAKKELSKNSADFNTVWGDFSLVLSYDIFKELSNSWIQKTLKLVDRAIKDASISSDAIDEIVLVGGSTRHPEIKKYLIEKFTNTHINSEVNPDEVVALGAAIEADVIIGKRTDVLLLDVTPLSLGIETAGGLMDVLVPRNSKVPTRLAREYTTSVDGQVNMKIAVYQGERELVGQNRKLGEFILSGIPAMPAGLPKIQIQFALNTDGILNVKAKELRSGVEQSIEIQPSYGLTDEQVENMLKAGLENAQTDVEERLILEAKNEAKQIIYAAQRFLEKNSEFLNEEEINGTNKRIGDLEGLLKVTDRHKIHQGIESLNDYTRPFAERIMDVAVKKALKGSNIN